MINIPDFDKMTITTAMVMNYPESNKTVRPISITAVAGIHPDIGIRVSATPLSPRSLPVRIGRFLARRRHAVALLVALCSAHGAAAVEVGQFDWHYAGSLAQPATGNSATPSGAVGDNTAVTVGTTSTSVAGVDDGLRLALIDSSAASRQWLDKNASYLRQTKIPVLLLDGNQTLLEQQFGSYAKEGLLIGAAPEPRILLDGMLQRLGITTIPAVVEGPVVWQVREVVPEAAFSASLPGSGGRAGAATEAPSTSLELEQGGNQSVVLEQDNDAQQRALEQALLQQYQAEEAQRASAEVRATLEQNLPKSPSATEDVTPATSRGTP